MQAVSKKLVNDAGACATEALQGMAAVTPATQILAGHRVLLRADLHAVCGHVALLTGGGSGHEPAHAGYIGPGMLTGVIAGDVFTSPPPRSILAAIQAVARAGAVGVLLIVKNYTGDRLNFGLAAERARAEGISVAMVVVAEDCALSSPDKTAGRRGLCGTILVHKIAGALAAESKGLKEIAEIASSAVKSMGTIGVSLSACSLPGRGPSFHLDAHEMELGLGIHGEAGVKRMQILPADETVRVMFEHMTDPKSDSHLVFGAGDNVALMVNNLGGTSYLELSIIARAAVGYLESKGLTIGRAYVGTFMSSLDMAGVSLTVMHLDPCRTSCLDADTSAPAWPRAALSCISDRPSELSVEDTNGCTSTGDRWSTSASGDGTSSSWSPVIESVCKALLEKESELNTLDMAAGDGDCGSTHARGCRAILKWTSTGGIPDCADGLLLGLAAVLEEHMGGTSGALYSLFLTAAAPSVCEYATPSHWVCAFQAGIEAIKRYGGADVGDRTLLDPLCAAYDELKSLNSEDDWLIYLGNAAKAAEVAAERTRHMDAHAGRASYVSPSRLLDPDPGAVAVATLLRALHDTLTS
uniref:triokinase/FMN cyclase n=1 Tax=Myxine glutinosa TaxID=7769 RepID=UPI00358F85F4